MAGFKKGDSGYVNVNDGDMIDHARRYQELVDKEIAKAGTPEGQTKLQRLLAYLDKVGAEREQGST